MQNERFSLTKWYADCITPGGDAVVVYCARLRWRSLSLGYASTLTCIDSCIESASSLRNIRLPRYDQPSLNLTLTALNLHGDWEARERPITRRLLETSDGSVNWNCVQPRSQACVRFGDGPVLSGTGYAECVQLTVAPWKLPIAELHWGRFHSEHDSLVWVDWRGPHTANVACYNGDVRAVEATADVVTFTAATGGPAELRLDCRTVLREGMLGNTVLNGIANLARAVPRNLLALGERKWLSRGVLRAADGRESAGWAIHEIVRWPQ